MLFLVNSITETNTIRSTEWCSESYYGTSNESRCAVSVLDFT